MSSTMPIDSKFMRIANTVLPEFGFSNIKELVIEQLSLMLQAKIEHYDAEDRLYASRFGQSYEMAATHSNRVGSESFEIDDALNDWRFAKEAAALYRAKMQELQSA